jgi:hypothetical protein
MEFVLLIWDELDDWTHACRHVAGSAVAEVATLSAPLMGQLATASSAVSLWILMALKGQ